LNTFVPNLVWLPTQVSKLSDREGGPVQSALKKWSIVIYKEHQVDDQFGEMVRSLWDVLPEPEGTRPPFDLVDELNWFEVNVRFLALRRQRINEVLAALESLRVGEPLVRKVIATRYTEGLGDVSPENRDALASRLRRFVIA
jgi:hypothetical protein